MVTERLGPNFKLVAQPSSRLAVAFNTDTLPRIATRDAAEHRNEGEDEDDDSDDGILPSQAQPALEPIRLGVTQIQDRLQV